MPGISSLGAAGGKSVLFAIAQRRVPQRSFYMVSGGQASRFLIAGKFARLWIRAIIKVGR
jgi:hypothetical protein